MNTFFEAILLFLGLITSAFLILKSLETDQPKAAWRYRTAIAFTFTLMVTGAFVDPLLESEPVPGPQIHPQLMDQGF